MSVTGSGATSGRVQCYLGCVLADALALDCRKPGHRLAASARASAVGARAQASPGPTACAHRDSTNRTRKIARQSVSPSRSALSRSLRRVDEAIASACQPGVPPHRRSHAVIVDRPPPCPHRPAPYVARPRLRSVRHRDHRMWPSAETPTHVRPIGCGCSPRRRPCPGSRRRARVGISKPVSEHAGGVVGLTDGRGCSHHCHVSGLGRVLGSAS